MDRTALQQRTRGIVVFAVTPMTSDGGVDAAGVRRNMEFLAAAGVPVVVVCGGVGELWDLQDDETRRVVEAAVDGAAGRMTVYGGAWGTAEDSVRRARAVESAGADGVLLFPDDDVVPDGDSVVDYYRAVSDAVDIGLMPFRADAFVDLDVLGRLADLPNVVALKEEYEHFDDFRQIVRACGDRFSVIGAGDAFAPCYFVLGAAGLACGLSNFVPRAFVDMWAAAQAWDYRRVMQIHESLEVFTALRSRYGTVMLKEALEILGLAGGPCRRGGGPMADADRRRLAASIEAFGGAVPT
jgi:dihydrodipicolinate synthase/N-acetylneuraminate lyase